MIRTTAKALRRTISVSSLTQPHEKPMQRAVASEDVPASFTDCSLDVLTADATLPKTVIFFPYAYLRAGTSQRRPPSFSSHAAL